MKLTHTPGSLVFQYGDAEYSFLSSGDVYQFMNGEVLVNEFVGSLKEGSANNLWLRIYEENEIKWWPMLGLRSHSRLEMSKNSLRFSGEQGGVSYVVTFLPGEKAWFWVVELNGNGQKADVVMGQDLGMASRGAVLTNELYASQYLGHTVFENENGYCVCSRQNMAQPTFPCLQMGMLKGRAVGYSTDGMQFFGLSYKATQRPKALDGDLENRNYQYECSYIALQSEPVVVNGKAELVFYGRFHKDCPDAVREAESRDSIQALMPAMPAEAEYCVIAPVALNPLFGEPYSSPQWGKEEISRRFPERELEEYKDGELLSFFLEDHAHVVTQQKELLCERPHGAITATAASLEKVDSRLLSTTHYIYGLFNGQTVVGNTSMHKFLSTPRGLLNILKNTGQRLWVKLDGQYRLLTLPSLFEVGGNYARWYYALPEDTLRITSFTACYDTEETLEICSESGKKYEFVITQQLAVGPEEFAAPVVVEEMEGGLRFRPDPESWQENPYPGLHYDLCLTGAGYTWSDDSIFFAAGESQNHTLFTMTLEPSSQVCLRIRGGLEEEPFGFGPEKQFAQEKEEYQKWLQELTSGVQLELPGNREVAKLNHTLYWYAQNAMIHYSVPHGLEQPGGAAWGTRDISQGPMELFLTMGQYPLARSVLLNIFAHQSAESGEWPQWFMFDRYTANAGDCHGDVVFWPLKCVGDYLNASGDTSILEEELPYFGEGRQEESLLEHLKTAVSIIEKRFLPGTYLISYAGGDWDDTLQPANEEMKERLVSAWTQALAYQMMETLGRAVASVDSAFSDKLLEMAIKVGEAFRKYLIIDGVIAGFVYREEDGSFRPMLHPLDTQTGIHYRLLPMTRSIIAGLADPQQAQENLRLIDENLACPDGVRLMDRPAAYDGGVSHLFCRAEQAANVGREISLQYVHAHIRYVEALCRMGLADKVWDALLRINPILLEEKVERALPRQSNLYFSSSEGAFDDRYVYAREFHRLREGTIDVKGGWRLYSSGPGIYLRQLVAGVLGLRIHSAGLEIDPCLPKELDGLRVSLCCFGRCLTVVYHTDGNPGEVRVEAEGRYLNTKPAENPYRAGGVFLPEEEIPAKELHVYVG